MNGPRSRRARTCGLRAPVAIALLFLAACSVTEGPPEAAAPEPVTAVVLPYLTHLPFHIAAAEGYFEQQDLDVEFRRFGRSQEFMTALAQGEVDVTAGMASVNEINLVAGGARLRLVGALAELRPGQCPFVSIVARHELFDSGVLDDPERLRDAVIDTDLLTPLGMGVDLQLRRHGVTIDDVQLVNVPPPAAVGALSAGTVDILIDAEPFLTRHRAAGASRVWAHVADLMPGFVQSVIAFGPTLLDERPEVGLRFAAALREGMRQFAEGKTERNLEIAEAAMSMSREELEEACWPTPPVDGRINFAAIDAYQRWSVDRGYVERPLTSGELVDARFFGLAGEETGSQDDAGGPAAGTR